MKLRNGSNRIYDGERFTIIFGSAYIADGGHRRPDIRIVDRKLSAEGKMRGKHGHRSLTIPLPHVRFHRCHKLRHVGGLRVYRAYGRIMRAICKRPKVAV